MFRLEFLLLPFLGLAFWLISGLITEYSLNQNNSFVESYNITPQTQPTNNISIKVTIDRDRGTSLVEIKQAVQSYQKQEFELTTIKLQRIETALSQKLDLPLEKVRRRLRYQIK